jgi:hypothetical protein
MRNAYEEIIKSKVAVDRVLLDIIPQLTLQGIYNQVLSDITELTSDNFDVNVNALFQIPGFFQLRMKHYAAMLAHFKARQAAL